MFGSLKAPKKPLPRGPEADKLVLRQQAHAVRHARRFLEKQAGGLWPGLYGTDGVAAVPGRSTAPRRRPAPRTSRDKARARWQLLRANTGPLERYVLALPGTLQYRLRADETGFRNLVFAGDWTRNGLEVGCAEGAVMSGLQAARALCDHPADIVGEHDLEFGMFAGDAAPPARMGAGGAGGRVAAGAARCSIRRSCLRARSRRVPTVALGIRSRSAACS